MCSAECGDLSGNLQGKLIAANLWWKRQGVKTTINLYEYEAIKCGKSSELHFFCLDKSYLIEKKRKSGKTQTFHFLWIRFYRTLAASISLNIIHHKQSFYPVKTWVHLHEKKSTSHTPPGILGKVRGVKVRQNGWRLCIIKWILFKVITRETKEIMHM